MHFFTIARPESIFLLHMLARHQGGIEIYWEIILKELLEKATLFYLKIYSSYLNTILHEIYL